MIDRHVIHGAPRRKEGLMTKRMILMLAVTAAFIAGLGFVKFQQIQVAIAQGAAFQPPPEAVTTIVARQEEWPATLSAIGTMAAVQGVTVSADLPGMVDRITFDSGRAVREGDVLVQLDTRQEQAQLAALEAQRDLARLNFDRMQGLLDERVISRAEYDRATAEDRQTEARVEEVRATIARKTVRAPFSGILGIRQVNLGQYLSAGDAVVPLQSLHPIYVNFGVPQQAAGQVRVGRNVRVTTDDLAGVESTGRVTAIDSIVDEATRNVQVQATLANPEGTLRPGMFVQTELILGASRPVIALPASAISYAPYGDSVFVVTDLKDPNGQMYRGVRQQFVKLEGARGDQVGVISGVNPGDEVVTSGAFKLRNGAAILVNNKIQPGNDPAPKPEDN
jgi:membrane fusion protein (multidrug efflux system)